MSESDDTLDSLGGQEILDESEEEERLRILQESGVPNAVSSIVEVSNVVSVSKVVTTELTLHFENGARKVVTFKMTEEQFEMTKDKLVNRDDKTEEFVINQVDGARGISMARVDFWEFCKITNKKVEEDD